MFQRFYWRIAGELASALSDVGGSCSSDDVLLFSRRDYLKNIIVG